MQSEKTILVILTNVSNTSRGRSIEAATAATEHGRRTGFDIREVAYLYHTLHKQHKYKLEFATLRGGEAPIDPTSMKEGERDSIVSDFLHNRELLEMFKNTEKLSNLVEKSSSSGGIRNVKSVLIIGGPGAMFDLPNKETETMTKVISTVYEENQGIVGTIGHGLAGLLGVQCQSSSLRKNEPFLKGHKVTGSTKEEDREMGWKDEFPFNLEDKVNEIGAQFEKDDKFKPNVIISERLVTAQNAQSIKEWMEKLKEACERRQ